MAETDSRILEYLEEGLFLYGVGKVQESIVRWRKVLELDPRNERAMDYIESAGGDVSQFRAKAGMPAKGGAAPAPAATGPQPPAQPVAPPPTPPVAPVPNPVAPPPNPVAPLPGRNVTQPAEPLDIGAFLAATGAAPPSTRKSEAPTASPMPWQAAQTGTVPARPSAPPMPSITTSTTVPSTLPPPQPVVAPPQPAPQPVVAQPAPQPAAPPRPSNPPQPAAPPPDPRAQLIAEAGVLFQARQFEPSLEVLERVAKEFPPVDDQLRQYLDAARNGLYEVLKAQWPRPDLIPEIRMNPQQVMSLKLSPEAGFIFSRIDGMSTVEEILAMGGLDPFTTLRALSQLVRAGVIAVKA